MNYTRGTFGLGTSLRTVIDKLDEIITWINNHDRKEEEEKKKESSNG